MAEFLDLSDLQNQIGAQRIVQYFDDDGDGVVDDLDPQVVQVLDQAEGQYYSRLLRAYSSKDALTTLANNDPVVKGHVIWIACELAAERKPEFTDAEGWGAWKVQYNRSIKELDLLSKGATRTIAEEQVGAGANTGGTIQPSPPQGGAQQFTFLPSRNDGSGGQGPGGFIIPLLLGLPDLMDTLSSLVI